MASENSVTGRHRERKAYLVMKAEASEALELAREWWEHKTVPKYVHVRSLQRDELEMFVDLYNRCFIASPDPFSPLTVEDAQKLETDGIFIAEMWGTPVGFIACLVDRDATDGSVYGEITGLGVIPSRRRRGVATALIQRAVEYFLDAGVEEVYCEVYEENWPSRMLITSYGFKPVGHREVIVESVSGDGASEPEASLPGGKIARRFHLRPRLEWSEGDD